MINQEEIDKKLNTHCYTFEKLEFNIAGVFDSFVDATYIMTMEGSQRTKEVYDKCKQFNPTSLIYIQHNKGFKKCNKILYEQKIPYDVINSYYSVFNHAHKNNYNNIMLLEDDFEFDTDVININMVNDVKTFFLNNQNKIFYYNLGGLPVLLQYPFMIENSHYKMIQTFPSHCIIYNVNPANDLKKRFIRIFDALPVPSVKGLT